MEPSATPPSIERLSQPSFEGLPEESGSGYNGASCEHTGIWSVGSSDYGTAEHRKRRGSVENRLCWITTTLVELQIVADMARAIGVLCRRHRTGELFSALEHSSSRPQIAEYLNSALTNDPRIGLIVDSFGDQWYFGRAASGTFDVFTHATPWPRSPRFVSSAPSTAAATGTHGRERVDCRGFA